MSPNFLFYFVSMIFYASSKNAPGYHFLRMIFIMHPQNFTWFLFLEDDFLNASSKLHLILTSWGQVVTQNDVGGIVVKKWILKFFPDFHFARMSYNFFTYWSFQNFSAFPLIRAPTVVTGLNETEGLSVTLRWASSVVRMNSPLDFFLRCSFSLVQFWIIISNTLDFIWKDGIRKESVDGWSDIDSLRRFSVCRL